MPSLMAVLIVEDNLGDVRLLQEFFAAQSPHTQLKSFPTGEEALRYLRRVTRLGQAHVPDLLLLDISLPKQNGWEILAALKAEPQLGALPVVMVSTFPDTSTSEVLAEDTLQPDLYLQKPKQLAEYPELVHRILAFWAQWTGQGRA